MEGGRDGWTDGGMDGAMDERQLDLLHSFADTNLQWVIGVQNTVF